MVSLCCLSELTAPRVSDIGDIFNSSLAMPIDTTPRSAALAKELTSIVDHAVPFTSRLPKVHNPYPAYNTQQWKSEYKGTHKFCDYPYEPVFNTGGEVLVFPGRPKNLPAPTFGSYELFDIDGNLCYERETRLGGYGYAENQTDKDLAQSRKLWDAVQWGKLQEECLTKNLDRYDMSPKGDNFVHGASSGTLLAHPSSSHLYSRQFSPVGSSGSGTDVLSEISNSSSNVEEARTAGATSNTAKAKPRTALLLRAYIGKTYTENDKQIVRSLVAELALKSGGEYQVFLLVQVKDDTVPIWSDDSAYDKVLRDDIPQEFWDMTILWNDAIVHAWYPALPAEHSSVHQAQWLSVQRFSQEHPEFDFVWNWELDSRYTGHHYDLLEKLAGFAKKQPRRGLWERNERFYIPAVHGDFDTTFRKSVERRAGKNTIWQAPQSGSSVLRTGPAPPVSSPDQDDYIWGVGEEADYITLGPIFDPVDTAWVGSPDVWGYAGGADDTPRRATIITQSRASKRLLDAMHAENLAGNLVSSEMTPQTVALHHGLKAVFAPHPVFMDRQWRTESLERWFNPGPGGESGKATESPFGWWREGRFQGSSWYFRADVPARLYNNWMGWEDSGMGGAEVRLGFSLSSLRIVSSWLPFSPRLFSSPLLPYLVSLPTSHPLLPY